MLRLPGRREVGGSHRGMHRAGLPTLGVVLRPMDPVLDSRPQHLTYSNAFVGQLHAFVEAATADAQVGVASAPAAALAMLRQCLVLRNPLFVVCRRVAEAARQQLPSGRSMYRMLDVLSLGH